MVVTQLIPRGLNDPSVLSAMEEVPREAFLPEGIAEMAYHDSPLPIGEGQTISQPYIVALMAEALEITPDGRVLEIGTGSGYAAAVISRIAKEVYTVERHASLLEEAAERFRRLGYENIHLREADGTLGWKEHAPYDGIVVTAGAPSPPGPLLGQLAVGGRLVIPIGPTPESQELVRILRREGESFETEKLTSVRFVPLVGSAGWRG
jgi:protein-L-isoaspartate(D-aspartate) O-methyltransferase